MKMKKIFFKIIAVFVLLLIVNCQEDNLEFGSLQTPTDVKITAEIVGKTMSKPYGDGSGKVKFVATANNEISFKFDFGDGTNNLVPSGITEKAFTINGVNKYAVSVTATGTGGLSSTAIIEVEVFSDFKDDEAVAFLTGGTQKDWYFSASEVGHLGVGPNNDNLADNFYEKYYAAAPFEKAASPDTSCLYGNVLTFTKDGNLLKYKLNNGGATFFNASYRTVASGGTTGNDDQCYTFDTTGMKTVSLSPTISKVLPSKTRGTSMTFSDNGFMGYYIGQTTYDIVYITANKMKIRAVQGNNADLAWYFIFTTSVPNQNPTVDYTNLVWSDEFNTDGAPDPAKWTYDLGTNNGWGNNESQNYTNSASNVSIAGGILKITAKKEASGGAQYSSARITTNNLYSFKYGKAVIRAKLPIGAGTWPAIWMLGQNIGTVGWPACGEIDIMEHVGNNQNKIYNTLHYPGNSEGSAIGNAGAFTNATASTAFHDYSVIWSATSIKFYVDNTLSYTFANSPSVPFNANFFLILNVAMGGNFGGTIDPAFIQSSMEVDYVKVYQ
jgi:Glycosyl hydrolases family 16